MLLTFSPFFVHRARGEVWPRHLTDLLPGGRHFLVVPVGRAPYRGSQFHLFDQFWRIHDVSRQTCTLRHYSHDHVYVCARACRRLGPGCLAGDGTLRARFFCFPAVPLDRSGLKVTAMGPETRDNVS